jgi:uncharacterized protein involved in exopolysaccharide biosynthesis
MEQNINLQTLVRLESDLIQVNMDLAQAEKERELYNGQISGEISSGATARLADPMVQSLEKRLSDLEVALNNLLTDATEEHPTVIATRKEIQETKIRLAKVLQQDSIKGQGSDTSPVYAAIEQQLMVAELRVDAFKARKNEIEKGLEIYRTRTGNIPESEKEYNSLTVDLVVNQNIYNTLKQQLESDKISQFEIRTAGTVYSIIAPARLPLQPSKPNILLMSIVSLVLGCVVGFGSMYLAEFSDHSFRGIEDARSFLQFPVVASVPRILSQGEQSLMRKQRLFIGVAVSVFVICLLAGIISGVLITGGG